MQRGVPQRRVREEGRGVLAPFRASSRADPKTTDRDRKVLLRLLVHEISVTKIDVPRHVLRLRQLWHTQAVTDIEVDLPAPGTRPKSPQWRVVVTTAPASLRSHTLTTVGQREGRDLFANRTSSQDGPCVDADSSGDREHPPQTGAGIVRAWRKVMNPTDMKDMKHRQDEFERLLGGLMGWMSKLRFAVAKPPAEAMRIDHEGRCHVAFDFVINGLEYAAPLVIERKEGTEDRFTLHVDGKKRFFEVKLDGSPLGATRAELDRAAEDIADAMLEEASGPSE
jgi:hypothetical protein